MAIYIKAIPMPKDGDLPIWIALHSDGTVEYNANKGDGWKMTTAVSIPPHGRLIDADALVKWFIEWYDLHAELEICHGIAIIADPDCAPTVIEAEEV